MAASGVPFLYALEIGPPFYTRMRRWVDEGVLDCLFEALQAYHRIHVTADCLGLDSTSVRVHSDGTGTPQKNGPQAIRKSRGSWNTKIHLIATNDRFSLAFNLSGGNAHDVPEGRLLLSEWGGLGKDIPIDHGPRL